jgi:hypothetical protein
MAHMNNHVDEARIYSDDGGHSRAPLPEIKLKEQAAGTGSSIRELVLLGVRRVVLQAQRPRPKRVEFPLIVPNGPQVDLTNEQIYEHVEFP